jgi:hypothetical protein
LRLLLAVFYNLYPFKPTFTVKARLYFSQLLVVSIDIIIFHFKRASIFNLGNPLFLFGGIYSRKINNFQLQFSFIALSENPKKYANAKTMLTQLYLQAL